MFKIILTRYYIKKQNYVQFTKFTLQHILYISSITKKYNLSTILLRMSIAIVRVSEYVYAKLIKSTRYKIFKFHYLLRNNLLGTLGNVRQPSVRCRNTRVRICYSRCLWFYYVCTMYIY